MAERESSSEENIGNLLGLLGIIGIPVLIGLALYLSSKSQAIDRYNRITYPRPISGST